MRQRRQRKGVLGHLLRYGAVVTAMLLVVLGAVPGRSDRPDIREADDPVQTIGNCPPPLPLPQGRECGNTFVGLGSANWSYGRYPGNKFAVSFIARQSKQLDRVWIAWKTAPGYGAGTMGRWTFELQADGPGHCPSGTILAVRSGITDLPDGFLEVNLPDTDLHAGTVYHLVMYNTGPDIVHNWSSPNTIMSLPPDPWPGDGVMMFDGKTWAPWGTKNHPLTPGKGCSAAYLLKYTDGTLEGMPYYSARERRIYADNYEGELIAWRQPDAQVSRLGAFVSRSGHPADHLYYTVDDADSGQVLYSGLLASREQVNELPGWFTAVPADPLLLQRGHRYRFYIQSPRSTAAADSYAIMVPYSSNKVAGWGKLSWGGQACSSIYFTEKKWQNVPLPADMTFSLVVIEQTPPLNKE